MVWLWLALACSGGPSDEPPPAEPFRGEADLTIDGSHAGAEDVHLGWVGWSRFLESEDLTLVASDDQGVWELIVVFDGAEAGEGLVPQDLFLKRGTQLFRDDAATCTADLSGTGGDEDPWSSTLSCTELATEEGSPNHEDRPFSLTATVTGETYTQDDYAANRFTADGWFAGPQVVAPEGAVVDFRDAAVLPWRDSATWVLFEADGDTSGDDVLLRVSPQDNEWLVQRWVRWGLDETTGAQLDVVAEAELTMGVSGRDADVTGTEFSLTLWESLQEGDDELTVVVK